jgi:vacuolar-type H+-ATPase subunit E/Vma4
MATSKKTTTKAAAPKADAVAAHGHAELEAKVTGLEKLVEELKKELKEHCAKSEKEHAELAAKCEAKASGGAAAVDPRVDKMWKWLRKDRIFRSEN